MAKVEFKKDPNRGVKEKTYKKIDETKASEPSKTFDLSKFTPEKKEMEKTIEPARQTTMGRPRKNKVYSTIRIQKNTINRINALQNTLEFDTQDDLVASLLDRLENQLENEQRIMFDMYMKTYEARDKKKLK